MWHALIRRLPHPPEELQSLSGLLLGSAIMARSPRHHRYMRSYANSLGGVYAFRIATYHVRVTASGWCIAHRSGACFILRPYGHSAAHGIAHLNGWH